MHFVIIDNIIISSCTHFFAHKTKTMSDDGIDIECGECDMDCCNYKSYDYIYIIDCDCTSRTKNTQKSRKYFWIAFWITIGILILIGLIVLLIWALYKK